MSDDSARGRFVEAMRVLKMLPGYQNAKEAACDAFADAECSPVGLQSTCPNGAGEGHYDCRATIRREVFGETR